VNDEEMAHYSAALDEIFRLRTALAYEAGVTEVHLSYKTFPKTRRPIASEQTRRMRDAAIGHSEHAYGGVHSASLRIARKDAGMNGLTRWQWESERPGVES
jgi:hypothetical protein